MCAFLLHIESKDWICFQDDLVTLNSSECYSADPTGWLRHVLEYAHSRQDRYVELEDVRKLIDDFDLYRRVRDCF
jgi:hypothetical protein